MGGEVVCWESCPAAFLLEAIPTRSRPYKGNVRDGVEKFHLHSLPWNAEIHLLQGRWKARSR